jgi:hypothetical protein
MTTGMNDGIVRGVQPQRRQSSIFDAEHSAPQSRSEVSGNVPGKVEGHATGSLGMSLSKHGSKNSDWQ